MGSTYSRVKTWSAGETLTASDLNAEFDNILNNLDPDGMDDASANATAMQATADPYPGASASLATDLRGEIQRLRYVIKQITGETQWYIDPDTDIASLSIYTMKPALFLRPKFTYNGGTTAYTIKLSPGQYWCKDKFCWWDAELTTSAIGSPASNTMYYLYLDYSAITSETEITNSELIWSSTAPTWTPGSMAWLNGDDRCIFCIPANSTPDNTYEFFHDGGNVLFYADSKLGGKTAITDMDYNNVAQSTTWDDVYLFIPSFATKALCRFTSGYGGTGTGNFLWRTNGQTGTSGHHVGTVGSGATSADAVSTIISDDSQIIEVSMSAETDNTGTVAVEGWYFPVGM